MTQELLFCINPLWIEFPDNSKRIRFWSDARKSPIDMKLGPEVIDFLQEHSFVSFTWEDLLQNFSQAMEVSAQDGETFLRSLLAQEVVLSLPKAIAAHGESCLVSYKSHRAREGALFNHPAHFALAAKKLGYDFSYLNVDWLRVEHENRRHFFYKQFPTSLLRLSALNHAQDKNICSRMLLANDLPAFEQISGTLEELRQQKDNFTYPIVIKPKQGRAAMHVVCNVEDVSECDAIIERLMHDSLAEDYLGEDAGDYVVEPYIAGATIRVLLVGYKVISALIIRRPSIVGDGVNTVEHLIAQHLGSLDIKSHPDIGSYLQKKNIALDAVLPKGQKCLFSDTAAPSFGGKREKIALSEEASAIMERVASVLALPLTEIEAIVPVDGNQLLFEEMKVIDINPAPDFLAQKFVLEGQSNEDSIDSFNENILVPMMQWFMESDDAKPNSKTLIEEFNETLPSDSDERIDIPMD